MEINRVKERLAAGGVSLGTMVFEYASTGVARLAAEARRLGYHATAVDELIQQAQSILARVEGKIPAAER